MHVRVQHGVRIKVLRYMHATCVESRRNASCSQYAQLLFCNVCFCRWVHYNYHAQSLVTFLITFKFRHLNNFTKTKFVVIIVCYPTFIGGEEWTHDSAIISRLHGLLFELFSHFLALFYCIFVRKWLWYSKNLFVYFKFYLKKKNTLMRKVQFHFSYQVLINKLLKTYC